MCSQFIMQSMENYQGDLADIIRGSGGGGGGVGGNMVVPSSAADEDLIINTTSLALVPAAAEWHHQFPGGGDAATSYTTPSGIILDHHHHQERLDCFGDPFPNMQDPLLLHDMDLPISTSPGGFFSSPTTNNIANSTSTINNNNCSSSRSSICSTNTPSNSVFSRMLQISPSNPKLPPSPCDSPVVAAVSPRLRSPTTLVSNDLISGGASMKGGGCLVESQQGGGLQISSPRNTGIKRRKSQAKKVVCIPAPAPANSRQSGEVVPSDLWAWRKYGQKPIKGSPYPRGYYRCSSSKGCSARKQVERSRTDPNMLVITYTSEHNHPWPTQRNALAGSTRSQPTKSNTSSKTSPSSANSSQKQQQQPHNHQKSSNDSISFKEEEELQKESIKNNVKEEDNNMEEEILRRVEMEMDDFPQSYKPALPDDDDDESNHHHSLHHHHQQAEDFFADLGEIEADPLNLLFNNQGNKGASSSSSSLDPFSSSFYDWPVENNTNSSSTSNHITTTTTTLLGGDQAKEGVQQNP